MFDYGREMTTEKSCNLWQIWSVGADVFCCLFDFFVVRVGFFL